MSKEIAKTAVNFWVNNLPTEDKRTNLFAQNLEHLVIDTLAEFKNDEEYLHLYSNYGPKDTLRKCLQGDRSFRIYFPTKARMNVYKDKVVIAGYQEEYKELE